MIFGNEEIMNDVKETQMLLESIQYITEDRIEILGGILEVSLDQDRNYNDGIAYFKYRRSGHKDYEPLRIPFEYTAYGTPNQRLQYIKHNKKRKNNVEKPLNSSERKRLDKVLRSQYNNENITIWKHMVNLFNMKCNTYKIPDNAVQPNYRELID